MTEVIVVRIIKGRYRWRCSCGRVGKRGYGFVGLAQLYGDHHLRAKHAK